MLAELLQNTTRRAGANRSDNSQFRARPPQEPKLGNLQSLLPADNTAIERCAIEVCRNGCIAAAASLFV